jgi:hypothetical protein
MIDQLYHSPIPLGQASPNLGYTDVNKWLDSLDADSDPRWDLDYSSLYGSSSEGSGRSSNDLSDDSALNGFPESPSESHV